MSTKKLVIIGYGGNCLDIAEAVLDINEAAGRPVYECIGFLDDAPAVQDGNGLPVLGPLSAAESFGSDTFFVNGIGSPGSYRCKERIVAGLGIPNERFATLVHPRSFVSRSASLGPGTVLLPNVSVSVNAVVGAHVIVLPGSVINHDAVVGDFCCLASGVCLSGNVRLGARVYVGCNACVREGTTVGAGSLIGMGAAVVADVPADSVMVGNPARLLRQA